MDKMEARMIQEIALRNAIAKFRRMTAAVPEVGIFWIDDAGVMYAESVSLRDAEDYGEFKIYEGNHFDSWDKAVRANPKWKSKEYEEVPRGRVTYRRDPKKPEFVVYMPKQIMKHKGKVVSRFGLPAGHVRYDTSDEHYRMGSREAAGE